MEAKKTVVILGAGPSGLAAGLELINNEYNVIIVERDNQVGGISKTVKYKDYHFDVGGHRFFTKNKEVNELWKSLLNKDFKKTKRLSRIYYNKKFFKYPIEIKDTLINAGLATSIACMTSYTKYRLFPVKPEKSFADWTSNRFGNKLFEMFFKSYTEKVWGVSTNELSAEWAMQRIKGLSLWEAVKNSVLKPKKKNKSLIDQFLYPTFGPGMMYEEMARIIKEKGGQILLNRNVVQILNKGNRVEKVIVEDDKKIKAEIACDYVISTIPLPTTIKLMNLKNQHKAKKIYQNLKFRDFISVNLIINNRDLFPDTWLYIHDPNIKMGRIQNYKNWSQHMTPDQNHSPIGCEYFCKQGDSFWNNTDSELIELASKELTTMNLINKGDVIEGHVYRMKDAYPIYFGNYRKAIANARQIVEDIANLHVAGRGGMFRYNNMDHSILTGLTAARNINKNNKKTSADIWSINADEEYQESE